jgi:hypothetical protein
MCLSVGDGRELKKMHKAVYYKFSQKKLFTGAGNLLLVP